MRATLRSTQMKDLLPRCRDLEARGFECVSPIQMLSKVKGEGSNEYTETTWYTIYERDSE